MLSEPVVFNQPTRLPNTINLKLKITVMELNVYSTNARYRAESGANAKPHKIRNNREGIMKSRVTQG